MTSQEHRNSFTLPGVVFLSKYQTLDELYEPGRWKPTEGHILCVRQAVGIRYSLVSPERPQNTKFRKYRTVSFLVVCWEKAICHSNGEFALEVRRIGRNVENSLMKSHERNLQGPRDIMSVTRARRMRREGNLARMTAMWSTQKITVIKLEGQK